MNVEEVVLVNPGLANGPTMISGLRLRGTGLQAPQRPGSGTCPLRPGAHKPTLALFVAASMGYVALRRATLTRFDRRIALRS